MIIITVIKWHLQHMSFWQWGFCDSGNYSFPCSRSYRKHLWWIQPSFSISQLLLLNCRHGEWTYRYNVGADLQGSRVKGLCISRSPGMYVPVPPPVRLRKVSHAWWAIWIYFLHPPAPRMSLMPWVGSDVFMKAGRTSTFIYSPFTFLRLSYLFLNKFPNACFCFKSIVYQFDQIYFYCFQKQNHF